MFSVFPINDIRDTGPDTENTDYGMDMGFFWTTSQPIRIENFKKPYNKIIQPYTKQINDVPHS